MLDKFMVCQPPCSWMDVKLGWPDRSDYTRRDASYLRMYFTTRVKAKNTAEDYPISSLVSDIGGYVGLMVGRTQLIQEPGIEIPRPLHSGACQS